MTWTSIEPAKYGGPGFNVYKWDTWPRGSLLEGQHRKTFVHRCLTEEEARKAYPEAVEGTFYRDAGNTFNHLPGEEDPVPGGMYPDDYDDGI